MLLLSSLSAILAALPSEGVHTASLVVLPSAALIAFASSPAAPEDEDDLKTPTNEHPHGSDLQLDELSDEEGAVVDDVTGKEDPETRAKKLAVLAASAFLAQRSDEEDEEEPDVRVSLADTARTKIYALPLAPAFLLVLVGTGAEAKWDLMAMRASEAANTLRGPLSKLPPSLL